MRLIHLFCPIIYFNPKIVARLTKSRTEICAMRRFFLQA